MQCQQANDLFSDYLETALDPALTVSVDNHLAACLSCREEMAGLRLIWTQLEKLPVQEPPATLHANITNALDTYLAEEKYAALSQRGVGTTWNWRTLFRPRVLAYAATLLILILGSLEVVQSQRAALGPLGLILHALHLKADPAAHSGTTLNMTATRSVWTANSDGSGALVVHLQSSGATGSLLSDHAYRAELVRAHSASGNGGHAPAVLTTVQGRFETDGNADVSLPLSEKLPEGEMSLIVTLDAQTSPLKVTVPLKRQ